MLTARDLLRLVLAEARETLGRSPEQVGRAVGVSGRTVRRLEDPDDDARPRRATLQALATFYGLDTSFVTALGEWDSLANADLTERLEELDGAAIDDEEDDSLRAVALRLARGGPGGVGQVAWLAAGVPGADDVPRLVELFVGLDRRRQHLALTLMGELVAARERERLPGTD